MQLFGPQPRGQRRVRIPALVGSMVLLLTSIMPSATVLGAGPTTDGGNGALAQCQVGFLGKRQPVVTTGCPTTVEALSTAPIGLRESVVLSGLTNPTAVRFAADDRVFIAEKSGAIKVYASLTDTAPSVFAGLTDNVQNYWDRGLLGLALDPSLTGGPGPTRPYLYVLYTYDHVLGSTTAAPRWGDTCPSPPGATTDGCVVSGRLSRFTVSGKTISGPEQVLIEDWCQQFPSHSIGTVAFGPDGALYVGGGDGASFTVADYGQLGGSLAGTPTARNPCGDPPVDAMTPPSAEGGALRSQDLRSVGTTTYASQVTADGAIAYWRLGESSGTVADDAVGTNDGGYLGSPVLGADGAVVGNTALLLDGTTGGITVADNNALDLGNGPLSYELWYKRSGYSSQGTVLSKGAGAPFIYLDYDGAIYAAVSGSGGAASAAGPDDVGVWHHLVVTKSAANAWKVYLDGVNATSPSSTLSTASTAASLDIGATTWAGTLDEVAVYATELTAARVQAHFIAASASGATADSATVDGAILRVDPVTGDAFLGNPYASSPDPNTRRIIAYGLRNPFRFALRPGTSELWVGDVGWGEWEEIDRIANISDATVENFGWPCYEGAGRQAGYDNANLSLCETLYASGGVTAPIYTYNHAASVVSGDTCATGSSAMAGMAFYPDSGGSYPSTYDGGLFFADNSRDCIWFMPRGADGQPDPAQRQIFVAGAANPVDLQIGRDGDLYYVDFDGGTVRHVSALSGSNQPPTARIVAAPTTGPTPLAVAFDGGTSSDPEGGALTYSWDLNGDTVFGDSTSATPSLTYSTPGTVTVELRVTDPLGATGFTTKLIIVGAANTPPTPAITTPVVGTKWSVGDLLTFSGSATDTEDGTLPASGLSWKLEIQHCPSNCHTHLIQMFAGAASGSFFAPDHEYPSYLDLTLTATDSGGASTSVTRRLDPRTVDLSFATVPSSLQMTVDASSSAAPFIRTVIDGSNNSMSAQSPQDRASIRYAFSNWSDGGAATHDVTARAGGSYAATFTPISTDVGVTQSAARSGQTVTVTIVVRGVAGATAQGVVVTDVLPSKLTYQSSSSTIGRCGVAGQTLTCSIGAVATGQLAVITLVTNAAKNAGSVTNTATVSSTTLDLLTSNNSASLTVRLR